MKLDEVITTLDDDSQEYLISSPCNDENTSLEDKALHEEAIDVYEMANLGPNTTGIQNIVVWVNGGVSRLQHGPRIKVVRGSKWKSDESSTIPLTGIPRVIGNASITQDEFAEIVKWIELNRDLLIKYGNDEMDTAEFIQQLKKV